VLFEMLTGRRIFEGQSSADVLAAVVRRDPDWALLPADCPWRVRDLLRRCLNKESARRLRDIGDARLELEDVETGEPNPPVVGSDRRAGRSAVMGWSVAGAAALIAAAALLMRLPAHNDDRPAMRFSAVTTFSGVETQPALSPDGRSVVFVSNRGGQWDVYVGLVGGGEVVRLTNTPEIESRPRWSPDGSRVLFARMNERGVQDLWVVSSLGGAARLVVVNAAQPSWSGDGQSIAYASGGVIWICNATGENPRQVTQPDPPRGHHQPAFSHDGQKIAFVRRGDGPYGELAVVDLKTGTVKRLTHDGALAWSPVWSPDDRFLYFTSGRGGSMNVWKIPSGSGQPQRITAGQGSDMEIDLSADGTRLVFASFRSNLNLAEISLEPGTLGQRKWLTSDAARGELAPRYSPDGQRIAYFSNRTGAEREAIWVMQSNGDNPIKLVEDDNINIFPHWTPDNQQIVYSTRHALLDDPYELRQLPVAGGAPHELGISVFRGGWGDVATDGRLIYLTSKDTLEIYDPRTNERHTVPDIPGEPLWSGDATLIAYWVRPGVGKGPDDEGLWIIERDGARRQIFRGWVTWFAWAGPREILALQGKPDFKGILWRVDTDGRRDMVLPEVTIFRREYEAIVSPIRFDVHPDGRRIVIEAVELMEADIGMIDHVN
jgi:Tol biopolymer transport system component